MLGPKGRQRTWVKTWKHSIAFGNCRASNVFHVLVIYVILPLGAKGENRGGGGPKDSPRYSIQGSLLKELILLTCVVIMAAPKANAIHILFVFCGEESRTPASTEKALSWE